MSEETELRRRSWKDLVAGVPTTQSNVKPLRKWDDMEAAINKCRNYLVQAEAEEHRTELAHKDAQAKVEEARNMLTEAENRWRDASKTLLGVQIDEAI